LTNATLPYVTAIASLGLDAAAHADPALARGVNTRAGELVNPTVASALAV
jgi:alanine dehydrogenase